MVKKISKQSLQWVSIAFVTQKVCAKMMVCGIFTLAGSVHWSSLCERGGEGKALFCQAKFHGATVVYTCTSAPCTFWSESGALFTTLLHNTEDIKLTRGRLFSLFLLVSCVHKRTTCAVHDLHYLWQLCLTPFSQTVKSFFVFFYSLDVKCNCSLLHKL